MFKKIKEILISNRFKSLYWRAGMMALSILVSGVLSNIDMLENVFSPLVVMIIGLVFGEISKAINNALKARKLLSEK